jgi:biopolymer transport protein ExbD
MAMATNGNAGPQINMTPLIDVLLVLLIIFMVITPVVSNGLPASIPLPASNTSGGRTIVIRVQADGALWINREPVTMETLGARLAQIYQTRAERVAFVQGDGSLEFREVARVIDVAKSAGLDHIGLI